MLTFDPKVGLQSEDTETIRARVQDDWKLALGNDLRVEPETPQGQLIDSETAFIAQKDAEILYLANQFNPETAEGIWQDALARIYFITRKQATPTVVVCRCYGLRGTQIPLGSVVKDGSNNEFVSTISAVILGSGFVDIEFAAKETGPLIVPANTVNSIITVIPGWDSVNNLIAGQVGRDEEKSKEFERRRYESVALNGHGTLASIYGSVANLEGVTDLFLLENDTSAPVEKQGVTISAHSIFLCVAGGDQSHIAEVLYRKKDAGCGTSGNTEISYLDPGIGVTYTYKIERPTPLNFAFKIRIRINSTTPSDIESKIKDAIFSNFYGEDGSNPVRIGSIIYASRFYSVVTNTGVQDLLSIEIAAPINGVFGNEIDLKANEQPVVDKNNIEVIIVS